MAAMLGKKTKLEGEEIHNNERPKKEMATNVILITLATNDAC